MKIKRLISILLTAAMLTAAFPATLYAEGTNEVQTLYGSIVPNGSFENNTNGWTAAAGTSLIREIADTYNGTAGAARITADGTISTTINVRANRLYNVSAAFKALSDTATVSMSIDNANLTISSTKNLISGKKIYTAGGWTVVTGTFKPQITISPYTSSADYEKELALSVTVAGSDCLIDELLITEAENQARLEVSAWNNRSASDNTLSIETVDNKDALKITTINKSKFPNQYFAFDKNEKYDISFLFKIPENSTADTLQLAFMRNANAVGAFSGTDNEQKAQYFPIKAESKGVWQKVHFIYQYTGANKGAGDTQLGFLIKNGSTTVADTFYLADFSIKKVASPIENYTLATLSDMSITPISSTDLTASANFKFQTDNSAVVTNTEAVTMPDGTIFDRYLFLDNTQETDKITSAAIAAMLPTSVTSSTSNFTLSKGQKYKVHFYAKWHKDSASSYSSMPLSCDIGYYTGIASDGKYTGSKLMTIEKQNISPDTWVEMNGEFTVPNEAEYVRYFRIVLTYPTDSNVTRGADDISICDIELEPVYEDTLPQITEASLDIGNGVISGSYTSDNANGYVIYKYLKDGVPVQTGTVDNGSSIPSYAYTEDDRGSSFTLSLMPISAKGTQGTIQTATAEIPSDFKVTIEDIDTKHLVGGSAVTANASVENHSGESISAIAFAGYYEDGVLIESGMAQSEAANGVSTPISPSLNLPQTISGNGTIRVFVWNAETLVPLCEAAEFGGNEVFTDGTFENEGMFYNNWAVTNTAATREQTDSGYSIKLLSNAESEVYVYSRNILPNVKKLGEGTYTVSFKAKSADENALIRARLYTRKANGEYLYTPVVSYSNLSTEWAVYSASVNIPDVLGCGLSDVSSMMLLISIPREYNNVSYPSQYIYLDDVSMQAADDMTDFIPSEKTSVFLVGDSICTNYVENAKNQQGWGYYFDDRFNENTTVYNCARGGWTTESYLSGHLSTVGAQNLSSCELWSGIVSQLKAGDWCIISLAHNDSSSSNARAVTKEKYAENLTKMIDNIRAKGASPLLVLSIPIVKDSNWNADGTYNSDNLITQYGAVMESVASTENVGFINLNTPMTAKCNELGKDGVRSAYYIDDLIHLNDSGAQYVCNMLVDLIKKDSSLSALSALMINE